MPSKYENHPDYIYNPASRRWVRKDGPTGKRLLEAPRRAVRRAKHRPVRRTVRRATRRTRRKTTRKAPQRVVKKKCNPNHKYANHPDYICNEKTGRWKKRAPFNQDEVDVVSPETPKKYDFKDEHISMYEGNLHNIKIWKKYFTTRYDACSSDISMIVMEDKNKLVFHNETKFRKSLKKCKKRFFIDFLIIKLGEGIFHANGIFVDKTHNKVYHFEPNGGARSRPFVNRAMNTLGLSVFIGYDMITGYDVCPRFTGLQKMEYEERKKRGLEAENEVTGYCVAWVMIFLHYCITNPGVHPTDIVTYLAKKPKLVEMLRRYVAFLAENIGIIRKFDR